MNRRGWITALLVAASVASLLLLGCSPKKRQKALSIFFDRSGKTPPPTHRVRRDYLHEIEELKRQLERAEAVAAARASTESEAPETGLPSEEAGTWEEVAELLPRDATGQVDWGAALRTGDIAPRPGMDPRAPEQSIFDLDVRLHSSSSELFAVTFSHKAHTQWLACGSCHPAIFSLRRGEPAAVITMKKLENGEQCGTCHGSVSFGVRSCSRCHDTVTASDWRRSEKPALPIEGASTWQEAVKLLPVTGDRHDWARALREGVIAPRAGSDPSAEAADVMDYDVEFIPEDDPDFKAVFSHATHTEWLVCESCHEALFEATEGANPVTMENMEQGKYCGACHGTVTFGVDEMETCSRCHPALDGE